MIPPAARNGPRSAAQTAQGVLDVLASSSRDEILIVDDAHRLPSVSLDELRLLSNLDFDRTPPFALLIVGQPALRDHLAQPELSSLWQRIYEANRAAIPDPNALTIGTRLTFLTFAVVLLITATVGLVRARSMLPAPSRWSSPSSWTMRGRRGFC